MREVVASTVFTVKPASGAGDGDTGEPRIGIVKPENVAGIV
jgi:hypothetical protein